MTFEQLPQKIEQYFKKQLPFVVYRKPLSAVITSFFQTNSTVFLTDYTQKGFVFAPFLQDEKTVFFPENQSEYHQFSYCKKENYFTKNSKIPTKIEAQKKTHIQLVEKGIEFIKKGEVLKVVVSRKEEVPLLKNDLFQLFEKMLHLYSNAFVYVWYHPKIGCWLGATPERLLTAKNQHFYTMALAGTQLYQQDEKIIWKHKELEEQQIVTDDIIQNLKKAVSNIKHSKPTTIQAGSLVHLKTDISGEIGDVSLKKIVQLLHPTPAVCGFPTQKAKEFIVKNEAYDRAYYSGFLGELNVNNKTELFVNLRCMQLKNNRAYLYVGGGLTKDSIAEKEWEETVHKSQIMKTILDDC